MDPIEQTIENVMKQQKCTALDALRLMQEHCVKHGFDDVLIAITQYKIAMNGPRAEFISKDLGTALSRAADVGQIRSCRYESGFWRVVV